MAKILKGAPVAEALSEKIINDVEAIKSQGVIPCLGIFRIGEREDDIAYERSILKKAEKLGVKVDVKVYPEDVSQEAAEQALMEMNHDDSIHGILMFRPVPRHLDEEKLRNMIFTEKDVDGCTDGSLAGVFTNNKEGFSPCTAEAIVELLDHYNIEVKGKNVVVIGRSLVVGRPLGMLLLHRDATVTYCHTKTLDMESITKKADILISTAGVLRLVGANMVSTDQVIIDAGINWDEEKNGISGDVDYDAVEPLVDSITPVPGGVGSVTTTLLFRHVIEAAVGCQRS